MTTYKTLWQKVLLRLNRSDGRAHLIAKECINDAQRVIARVQDFDELIINDTANAATVANTSEYNAANDWGLTRPKDILSIVVSDTTNSRKLTWVSPNDVDKIIPYPDILGTGYPDWYTLKGANYVLYKTPSNAWSLYIRHSQWPVDLANDTDETQFLNIDDVLIGLATDMSQAILDEMNVPDWTPRAKRYLLGASEEQEDRPDRTFVAQPFNPKSCSTPFSGVSGNYWNNPFIKSNP